MKIAWIVLSLTIGMPTAWAKTLTIPKGAIQVNQLHEELLARFPAWRGTPRPDGTLTDPLLRVEFNDHQVILVVPDEADEAQVRSVIASHVPRPRPQRLDYDALEAHVQQLEAQVRRLEAAVGLAPTPTTSPHPSSAPSPSP